MRYLIALVAVLAGCNSCTATPSASSPTDQVIYNEIVEAGCMAPDPVGGVQAVHAERALNPPVAWMNCLANSGTVAGCAVPCTKSTP